MKNLTLENIANVCNGIYRGDEKSRWTEVTAITSDSRQAAPGCLFVPIVGERGRPQFYPQCDGGGSAGDALTEGTARSAVSVYSGGVLLAGCKGYCEVLSGTA